MKSFLSKLFKTQHGQSRNRVWQADWRLNLLEAEMRDIMQEFDNLKANVAANTVAIDNLAARIAALPAGGSNVDPAEVQALADAVAVNTAKADSLAVPAP
jgi:hypothetical protein